MLADYQREFIELSIQYDVLKFGSFTLKSGRQSPYFFNAGLFNDGYALSRLGSFYAQAILDNQFDFDHIFGPAYKGIPLASATAIALSEKGINKTLTFNRKEAKDHGEGGNLIGAPLKGKTLVIDDVITAGTAFYEAKQQIESQGGEVSCSIIALDRCERGKGQTSTLKEIQQQGIKVASIITLNHLIDFLKQTNQISNVNAMEAYRREYGC
ncbi:orotate phosphoribosyltransferase [Legionella sp. W05-934-2]|jgi:orotate phosphoribosyltransferase|uniref:orotate phosphoribosyltransferase n=1 Tax=Legionella sp. W05-934-2 TaxID=1198649 RepID=UPI003461DD54